MTRTGYDKPIADLTKCDIPIKKFHTLNPEEIDKIGTLTLKDNGFTVGCTEVKAMEVLNTEACAINADLIVITEETRSDFQSSCYRCTAEFYRFKADSSQVIARSIQTDYDNYDAQKRTVEDKKRNRKNLWTALGIGFMIGFISVISQ